MAHVFGQGPHHLRRSTTLHTYRPAIAVRRCEKNVRFATLLTDKAGAHRFQLSDRLRGLTYELSNKLWIVDAVAGGQGVLEMLIDAVFRHVGDIHDGCETAACDRGAAALAQNAFQH